VWVQGGDVEAELVSQLLIVFIFNYLSHNNELFAPRK